MVEMGRILVALGVALAVIGGIVMLLGRTGVPLGRLPGDFLYRGKNTTFYFPLKEESSQIRVVMFRSSAKLLRFRPENGLHVTVRGRITVYEERGELQISAEFMEPQGAGALQLAFEQLKARLQAEGLFEASRRKLSAQVA